MDFFQQIDNIALLEPAAHFELFRSISNALNSKDSGIQAVGRNHLIKVIPLIQWINENLGVEWSLAHCLSNGIGIHDGSMPKHITVSTIKYFNDQKLKFLFCTNTIIEGVNTSAKNVIYYDSKIGTRDVDYFDYANIRGRAGRLMEHCVGRVINLKKPPQAKEMSVDIPAYTQNPIDDEVLVNIEKAEVKPFNMERYQRFENLPEELKIILKRNAVSIKDQLELLPIIRAMLIDPHRRGDIVWSELRDRNLYNHLCIIFDLVKDRFVEGNDKNVLISTKWMATQTVSYLCFFWLFIICFHLGKWYLAIINSRTKSSKNI